MRDLQPFIKNISCGKCLVSPAKEEVEAVSTCPSSASAEEGYVCSTPRQSESSDGSHLKFNKVVKKKKDLFIPSTREKILNLINSQIQFLKPFCKTDLRQLQKLIAVNGTYS